MRLTKTKAAIEAADAALAAFHANLARASDKEAWALLMFVERQERAVGEAFAEETADRNDPETARLVRPGDPWLRRMVEEYG
jgi:hypothetical protein